MSTFVSDFAPRTAPVIASASFLALAALDRGAAPQPRRAAGKGAPDADERARIAALLRGGLSGGSASGA